MRGTRAGSRVLVPVIVVIVLLLGIPAAGLVLARSQPDKVAAAVDWVRTVIGPAPVAAAENVFYRAADAYNRLRYQVTGAGPTWKLAAPAAVPAPTAVSTATAAPAEASLAARAGAACVAAATCAPTPAAAGGGLLSQAPGAALPILRTPAAQSESGPAPPGATAAAAQAAAGTGPAPLAPLLAPALAGEGVWQPLATAAQPAGQPALLWQTIIRPDPARPFARVALVAMDLSRSQLHLVIGTKEPVSSIPAQGRRPGFIPPDEASANRLLAAWNGGFRAVHGHFGIMTDGTVWLPADQGLQTVAIGRDGRVVMGPWGQSVNPDGDWLAWRQNNPPLIDQGQVNPDVIAYANTIRWGASIDGAVFIWRSGMGLAGGRRWLIYAVGNSLSVATLTSALHAAGCDEAMQLDVNASYERFVTFSATPQAVAFSGGSVNLALTAHKLIEEMAGGPTQFLLPDDRDFFYLTLK